MARVSALHTLVVCVVYFTIASTPIFDSIENVEMGFEHYAEKQSSFAAKYFPSLRMPLNTFVNVGYVVVGIYWLLKIYSLQTVLQPKEQYCFRVFAWMSTVYGSVQCLRIYTQLRFFALLDQWLTLPIFAWFYIIGHVIKYKWNAKLFIAIIAASSCSYFLSNFFFRGFEVALSIHIICDVAIALSLYKQYHSPRVTMLFFLTLFACGGFVVLKLADFELLKYGDIFAFVSGHFLSKICDILQIHWTFDFFLAIIFQRNKRLKQK